MLQEDLQVNGPGSPVSLKKVLQSPSIQLKELNVFVCNDTHIVKDDPDVLYITHDICKTQALYFLESIFDGRRFPHYCYHHLLYLYGEDDSDIYKKYPDSNAVRLDFLSNKIKDTDEDYKKIQNLFIYSKEDPEFLQLLGLIQCIAGAIRQGVRRIYLEHPETHLHPKRCSRFMTTFNNIKNEYMPKDPADTEYDPETASLRLKIK